MIVIVCMYSTTLIIFAFCVPVLGPAIELILSPLICIIFCIAECVGIIIIMMLIITAIFDLVDILITYLLIILAVVFQLMVITLVLVAGSSAFITEVDFSFPFLSVLERILEPLGGIPKDILNILDFKIIRESPGIVLKLLDRLPPIGLTSIQGLCKSRIFSGEALEEDGKLTKSNCLNVRDLI